MESITLIAIGICLMVLLLGLTLGALLYVSGLLSTIDVGAGDPPIGKATVAYKFARGSYRNSGDLFNEVTKYAPEYKCLGIYYDDPKVIPEDKLRYAVGAILSEGEVKVEQEAMEKMQKAGFNIITLPEVSNCVKTTFPYINTLSILIGVWRVYPRFNAYIKRHRLCAYPYIEIYTESLIYFMAPLAKQDVFFVPECKEDVPSEYEDESIFDQSEGSPSSSASRSVSRVSYMSNASHLVSDDQEESDLDESFNASHCLSSNPEEASCVDVRPSKAQTNLLESQVEETLVESRELSQASPVSADKGKEDESINLLHDSGISSGRTSAVPSELNTSLEATNKSDTDGNDSASSFEEIHMK